MARNADGPVELGRGTWVRAGLIVAVTGRPAYYGDDYALPVHAGRDEVRATVLLTDGRLLAAYDDAETIAERWRAALGERRDG